MKMKIRPLKTKPYTKLRKPLLICAMIVVGFFLLVLILTPLRNWGANKYLDKGDQKLANLDYISADIEYQKACLLTPFNTTVSSRISLVKEAEKNVLVLKDFFINEGIQSALNDLKAVDEESDAPRLIALSRDFINRNQPAMAVVTAKKAVGQKENYRDGLLYLSIAYDRAARVETIRQESADYLLEQSKKYLELAHESDPAFFATHPN